MMTLFGHSLVVPAKSSKKWYMDNFCGGTDTSGIVCLGLESQSGFLAYVLCRPCAMDSQDSSLVRHLLTSLLIDIYKR